jgi:hypothetical protein
MTFPWELDPFEQIAQRMRELDVPEFLRRDASNRAPWMSVQTVVLPEADFDALASAINNPKPPTKALVDLMHRPTCSVVVPPLLPHVNLSPGVGLPAKPPEPAPPWATKNLPPAS